jgi:hypothetical protein
MNHFMMGHLNNLLVPYFLGIWRQGNSYAIAPHPVGDLTWCKGEMDGISVSWHYEGDTFVLDADIPAGRQATVRLPFGGRQLSVGSGHHTWKEKIND